MPVVAIVPVKSFELGKGRLSSSLTQEQRRVLGMGFTERTVTVAEESGLIPLVVAGDPAVTEWALLSGIPSIHDTGEGLNKAAASGVEWAELSSAHWMILHSDLPLLSTDDLKTASDLLEGGRPVLAPSSDGGTSMVGGVGPRSFSYGPGSFFRHLARDPDSAILTTPGLLHDVDSPNDLEAVMGQPGGQWVARLIG